MQPAFAESDGGPWEKWSLSLGGFAASLSNDVRIGTPGVGAEINLENALGLESSETVFRVDAAYRFRPEPQASNGSHLVRPFPRGHQDPDRHQC